MRTELNGHDIFTANGGVGLAFDEVGPDLLSRVDVYKNPSAEMIEGSLGGTIDLRTRKPFDASGRILAATASTTRYDLAEEDRLGSFGALQQSVGHGDRRDRRSAERFDAEVLLPAGPRPGRTLQHPRT
ncbi:hypothetical protein ACRAWD_30695 [Caulobacter segnis]